MSVRKDRAVTLFLLCFLIGLGLVHVWQDRTIPEKPIVSQETGTTGTISKVAAQVSPSVVGICNLSGGKIRPQAQAEAAGSGVIIDTLGNIVTNNHVVAGAQKIVVTLADGDEQEATVVGTDPRTDLALIKIKANKRLTPVQFGDSEKLVVGEEVVAIGNPLGLRLARSVTAGIVSGLNRLVASEEGAVFRLIQTDAAINPGNSGGALVDLEGRLVGINTIKIAAQGFEGLGFAIPSNQVQSVVASLKKNGKVYRPVMGIRILGEITPDIASYYSLPVDYGVIIIPNPGGVAQRVGFQDYDIITRLDGQEVKTGMELQEKIFACKIGQKVKVDYIRISRQNGKIQKMTRALVLEQG